MRNILETKEIYQSEKQSCFSSHPVGTLPAPVYIFVTRSISILISAVSQGFKVTPDKDNPILRPLVQPVEAKAYAIPGKLMLSRKIFMSGDTSHESFLKENNSKDALKASDRNIKSKIIDCIFTPFGILKKSVSSDEMIADCTLGEAAAGIMVLSEKFCFSGNS